MTHSVLLHPAGTYLTLKPVFVPQKPFCATKRLAPGAASAVVRLQSRHLIPYEKPTPVNRPQEDTCAPSEMGRLHQNQPGAKGTMKGK